MLCIIKLKKFTKAFHVWFFLWVFFFLFFFCLFVATIKPFLPVDWNRGGCWLAGPRVLLPHAPPQMMPFGGPQIGPRSTPFFM